MRILTICLLFIAMPAFAQRIVQDSLAWQQVKSLRKGVLVVRLKTREKTIEAYRNAGNMKLAEKIAADKKKENRAITDAFQTEFRFCPVRFIFSEDSRNLVAHDTVSLLNAALEVAGRGSLKDTFFLIAEYGLALDNVRSNENEKEYKRMLETTEGTQPSGSPAFIILDTTMKQLQPPFPAVAFPNPLAPQANQMPGAISRLNARLFNLFTFGPASIQRKENKKRKKGL
jgi:hypothetical protein